MTATITRRQFGLGAAAATGLPLSAQAAMTLKYGNAGNINSISNQFAIKLFETVKARTNGEIETEVFAGTLGGEKTLIEGLALGTLDSAITAYTGTREFDIFYSPFFFRDGAHAGRVVNGPLRDRAGKVLEEKYNAKFLGIGRLGRWCLFVQEPIESLADIKGMKIRAPQIEGNIRSLEHLGANPTPVPFNEVYTALQQGLVDGMVTSLNVAVTFKFYEVCKYVVQNEFGLGLDKLMVAQRVWDRLTPEQQQIMQSTFDELEPVDYFKKGEDVVPSDLKTWEDSNGAGTALSIDPAAAIEAMAPLNKQMAEEVYGPGTWEEIQAL